MIIKPSTGLRNEYTHISELAKASGEPIYITNKGEADIVVLSMDAYEEREKMFHHRDLIYEAEFARLSGAPIYSSDDIRAELELLYAAAEK
ncbi:type II toxin-antitoxin system Phd/YefM family antitoxin [bacterium]|nr:type II toxin-antitoxin system Phd/YefM family antitoxin [candidate division CSSED10-310 bacterium]